jgi:hypothetical protein
VVDPTDLSLTVVGPHDLPAGHDPRALTYDAAIDALVSLSRAAASIFLVRYDRRSGHATIVSEVTDGTDGESDGLEYVSALDSLVYSKAFVTDPFLTSEVRAIDLSGNSNSIVTTSPAIDQDLIVYDSSRSLFYSADPNGAGQLVAVDLEDGTHIGVGPVSSSMNDLAYDPQSDAFFALDSATTNVWKSPAGSIGFSIAGTTPVQLRGIAFVTRVTKCSDGIDNDGDGFIDFPEDPGCAWIGARNEDPRCSDGIDNSGHLASITSAAEQQFIEANFLTGEFERVPLWIGGRDEVTEGTWEWSDGEPFSPYTTGRPANRTTRGREARTT